MATTTVLVILSLTIVPSFSALLISLAVLRPQQGLDARQIAPDGPHLQRRLQLSHGLLDAQAEELVVELPLLGAQVVGRQVLEFHDPGGHYTCSCAKRVANFVRMG